jgi:hypothetical protein
VNLIMQRLAKDPAHMPDGDTLIRLAEAADVSLDWFAKGQGLPQGFRIGPDAEYPTRPSALAAARILGIDPSVIDQVREMTGLKSDPGPYFWFHQILARTGRPMEPGLLALPPSSSESRSGKKRRQKR